MRQITINLYKYDELSPEAQENAREWFSQYVFDHGWWGSTYADAAQIGLKITSFNLGRSRHAKGEFTQDAMGVAENILKHHGEVCDTYQEAKNFIAERAGLIADLKDEDMEEYENLCDEFRKALLECYSITLQEESEYMLSEEYLAEGIRANDYEFTQDGEIA